MPPGARRHQGPSLGIQADWGVECDVWGICDSLEVSQASGGGPGFGFPSEHPTPHPSLCSSVPHSRGPAF